MIVGKHTSLYAWVLFLVTSSLLLTGCGQIASGPTQTTVSSEYGTQEQAKLQNLSCPDENENFELWLSHYARFDIDAGEGESIFLEFRNLDPVSFDLWINKDGTVTNEGLFRHQPISYYGVATHPGDKNCPVQTFEGSWELYATITGTCANDIVRIHIIEEWKDPVLVSDCTGPVSPGTGMFSAPEGDLTFNLKDEIPNDSIELMGGGPFQLNYTYYLWPSEIGLPLAPLVPERD